MGYSNFKILKNLTKKFGLSATRERLFNHIQPIEASAWLLDTLKLSELLPLTNEK